MSDKIEPFANARELNLADAELNGPWPALYRCIEAYERLHAEVERLKLRERIESDAAVQAAEAAEQYRAENEAARAALKDADAAGMALVKENERLRALNQWAERNELRAENERLRAALRKIGTDMSGDVERLQLWACDAINPT